MATIQCNFTSGFKATGAALVSYRYHDYYRHVSYKYILELQCIWVRRDGIKHPAEGTAALCFAPGHWTVSPPVGGGRAGGRGYRSPWETGEGGAAGRVAREPQEVSLTVMTLLLLTRCSRDLRRDEGGVRGGVITRRNNHSVTLFGFDDLVWCVWHLDSAGSKSLLALRKY